MYRIRIRNYCPYPDSDFSINKPKINKNLDSCCLVTSWLFIFEDLCKCTQKVISKNKLEKTQFCLHLGSDP